MLPSLSVHGVSSVTTLPTGAVGVDGWAAGGDVVAAGEEGSTIGFADDEHAIANNTTHQRLRMPTNLEHHVPACHRATVRDIAATPAATTRCR
jgi:hypothetical protein